MSRRANFLPLHDAAAVVCFCMIDGLWPSGPTGRQPLLVENRRARTMLFHTVHQNTVHFDSSVSFMIFIWKYAMNARINHRNTEATEKSFYLCLYLNTWIHRSFIPGQRCSGATGLRLGNSGVTAPGTQRRTAPDASLLIFIDA